jgi:hypothetical protein
METRFAALTVTATLALTDSKLAEMVAFPTFFAVASPLVVMETTEVADEAHVATPVTSCVVPSEKVAFAVNCCDKPRASVALEGVITIEVAYAAVTVMDAAPDTVPDVAVMLAVPAASARAKPLVGEVSLTVATNVFEEAQVTALVRFCVLPSL